MCFSTHWMPCFFWLLRRLSYSKEDQESRVDRLAGDEAETFVLPLAHAEWGFHRYTLCAIRCLAGKDEWSFWINSEHRCFLNSWAMMRTGRTLIQECHFLLLRCTGVFFFEAGSQSAVFLWFVELDRSYMSCCQICRYRIWTSFLKVAWVSPKDIV